MWTAVGIAVLGSTGLWTVINVLIQRHYSKKDAILALLHDRVYEIAQRSILRGSIGFNEFDNLTELYTAYEKRGGNGTGKKLYDEASKLHKVLDVEL